MKNTKNTINPARIIKHYRVPGRHKKGSETAA